MTQVDKLNAHTCATLLRLRTSVCTFVQREIDSFANGSFEMGTSQLVLQLLNIKKRITNQKHNNSILRIPMHFRVRQDKVEPFIT